ASRARTSSPSGGRFASCAWQESPRSTSFRTRRDRERGPRPRTRCRRRRRRNEARGCGPHLARLASSAGTPSSAPRMSCSSTARVGATGTTTRRGWSMRPWASSSGCEPQPSWRRGSSLPEDCLFCRLYREGDHVRAADGFVAIKDINPRADIHLLVIPERHVEGFREIGAFEPEEAKRMLQFVAETASEAGLEDYRVVVNVGEGAGQTIFHLHWHVLGGRAAGL